MVNVMRPMPDDAFRWTRVIRRLSLGSAHLLDCIGSGSSRGSRRGIARRIQSHSRCRQELSRSSIQHLRDGVDCAGSSRPGGVRRGDAAHLVDG